MKNTHDEKVTNESPQSKQRLTAPDLVAQVKPLITEVSPEETKKLLQDNDVILIDIREESEVEQGSITGAKLIPRGVLEFKISELDIPDSPEAKVILYCRSGGRSALAASSLQNMGFKNVMSMSGGYEAWKTLEN